MVRLAVALAVVVSSTWSASAHADAKKFAVAMPHFNVQYVAGGMVGFWSKPDPRLDLNAEQVEDLIVVESFEPVLDLFAAHPGWATDVELQGYMLDVIAKRHPKVLAKLKDLVDKGQIEVVSFHYSDQLFLAHAPEDWEHSSEINRATFARLGIPVGGPVFCQEGQASTGMAAAMKKNGQSVMVWPKNLWSYQLGDTQPSAPLFEFGEILLTTSRGGTWDLGSGNTVQIEWTFVDDGELLATGDKGPYTPDVFKKSPAALAKYEADLANLEAGGFQITTVAKMAEQVKALAPPPKHPALLDGTWQPKSTDGIRKWLGGAGIHGADERDNDVRTLAQIAHRELVAAETIAAKAGLDVKAELEGAFRLLALGEVSDASGINPFRGEIEYGLAHDAEALRIARSVIARGKAKLGLSAAAIDPIAATVSADPLPAAGTSIDPPIALRVESGDRKSELTWTRVDQPFVHSVATVRFEQGQGAPTVTVPGTVGLDIGYTPALTSTPVHVPRSGFVWDHYMLALHDGLIAFATDRWIVKDTAYVHVAARLDAKNGDLVFKDDTSAPDEAITWVFHLVDGNDAAAADAARRLNVSPKVWR